MGLSLCPQRSDALGSLQKRIKTMYILLKEDVFVEIEEELMTGPPQDIAQIISDELGGEDPRTGHNLFRYALERVCAQPNFPTLLPKFLDIEDMSGTQWIEFVLRTEYGEVPADLQNKSWEILKLSLRDVRTPSLPQEDENGLVRYNEFLHYNPSLFLSCLVDEADKIVDGYNRYRATVKAGKNKIWVVRPKHRQ